MKRVIAKLLFLAIIGPMPIKVAHAQRPAAPETLIRNATVITVTHGTLQNTDVLMRNGKIAAVGKNLSAPNARVIDGTGKYVMPGIIDCHSTRCSTRSTKARSPSRRWYTRKTC